MSAFVIAIFLGFAISVRGLDPELLFISTEDGQGQLQKLAVDAPVRRLIPIGNEQPTSITCDVARDRIYYAVGDQIRGTRLDGSGIHIVVSSTGSGSVTSMALDWVTQNVYLIGGDRQIYVCSVLSSVCAVVVKDDGETRRGLVVHPHSGSIFYVQYGFMRAGMDGSSPVHVGGPTDVFAIDQEASLIYWIHNGLDYNGLQVGDLNGNHIADLAMVQGYAVIAGMAAQSSQVYWTQYTGYESSGTCTLQKFDNKTGQIRLVKANESQKLGAPLIISTRQQPQNRENHCAGRPCSHLCVLTNASFACLCPKGFQLRSDNRTCHDFNPMLVMLSENDEATQVQTLTLSTSIRTATTVGQGTPGGLAVDVERAQFYWSFSYQDGIYRGSFENSTVERVTSTGGLSVRSLAYDWIAENIYYTDDVRGHIGVCSIQSGACAVLVTTNVSNPTGIALHPRSSTMYWTQCGIPRGIFKATMDGNSVAAFIQGNLRHPEAITIDYTSDRLYWSDPVNSIIGSVYLDGNDPRTVITLTESRGPFGIAFLDNKIYWTEYSNKESFIKRVSKPYYTDVSVVMKTTPGFGQALLGNLAVSAPSAQPLDRTNDCRTNPCSHICVLSTTGFRCLCAEGYELLKDSTTCSSLGTGENILTNTID